ncbi:hypothetical protein B0H19DRAFT_1073449 [Mycena capillaripes]|nr:hypothetical protein B0H19DRAFT_1073449 [Mycena capillaripes]
MRRFPSELEDVVVDFCHEDHTTLASCGLVCRDWLPVSRFHLFSSISLTTENAPAFLDILTLSKTIPALVQTVELRFSGDSLLHLQVVPILILLTRTTRLTLRPARDEVTRPVCTSSLSRALTALPIVHLKFDFNSRFEALQQVIDCACLCPQLESLEVGGSWQRTGSADFPAPMSPQFPKGLHTLTLTCDLANFLTWVLSLAPDDQPVIQHLVLHHIVCREISAVVRYLHTAGPALKSLVLAFRDNDAPSQLATQADLTQNTSLRDLKLEGNARGLLSSLWTLLPQLHLCGVETLELTMRHASWETDDIFATYSWDKLDAELCFLKHLTLQVVVPLKQCRRQDIEESILAHLPLVRAHGILAF